MTIESKGNALAFLLLEVSSGTLPSESGNLKGQYDKDSFRTGKTPLR
jgi:hypothetical protein